MQCEHCKKTFSNKFTLKTHQTKAKYCLKIQGKLKPKVKQTCFNCKFCNKEFNIKSSYIRHENNCHYNNPLTISLQKENDILKEKVSSLEKQLSELQTQYNKVVNILAAKPTNTTNNTTNNILNMPIFDKSDTDIKRIVDEKYDRNFLIDGQKGVARFTDKHITTDENGNRSYMISDVSRGNGKYKTSETEVVTDPEMKGLTRKIHPAVKEKAIKLVQKENPIENKILFDGFWSVNDMDKNNASFRKEFTSLLLTSQILKLQDGSQIKN